MISETRISPLSRRTNFVISLSRHGQFSDVSKYLILRRYRFGQNHRRISSQSYSQFRQICTTTAWSRDASRVYGKDQLCALFFFVFFWGCGWGLIPVTIPRPISLLSLIRKFFESLINKRSLLNTSTGLLNDIQYKFRSARSTVNSDRISEILDNK